MNNKLVVLAKIAKELNESNVRWAIAASTMLFLKKIVNEFNDLDIVLESDDIQKLVNAFEKLGAIRYEPKNNDNYKSKYFIEYNLMGVDIDVIAGFKIVRDSKIYDCSFKNEDVDEYVDINGQMVPLDNIHNWRNYYLLMNRLNKVTLIDNFINNKL